MPRPRQHVGRPGTRVVPKEWESSHSQVLAKTHTATCEIRPKPSAPAKANTDLSYTPATPDSPIYTGACRVQIINRTGADDARLFGDEHQNAIGYLVAVDFDADGITPGCLVTVTASNDPDLSADVRLVVTRVELGSLRFERDLYCVDARHQA